MKRASASVVIVIALVAAIATRVASPAHQRQAARVRVRRDANDLFPVIARLSARQVRASKRQIRAVFSGLER